jgi:hypothetical protein
LHLLIILCVKCVFNARYHCTKHSNYEWTNFALLPSLSCEMLNLQCGLYIVTYNRNAPNECVKQLEDEHKTCGKWAWLLLENIYINK